MDIVGEGVDSNEIFYLDIRHTSVICYLPWWCIMTWEIEELYLMVTFIYHALEENILTSQPCGFSILGKRAIFVGCINPYTGWRIAIVAHEWYERFNSFMIDHVCDQVPMMVMCIIRSFHIAHTFDIVVCYMLITSCDIADIQVLKLFLSSEFDIKFKNKMK